MKKKKRKTDCERVLNYLLSGRTLTPMTAMKKLGIMALSQRIGELRRNGWDGRIERPILKTKTGRKCCYYSIPSWREF